MDFTEDAMGILYVWPFIWTPVEAIRRIVWLACLSEGDMTVGSADPGPRPLRPAACSCPIAAVLGGNRTETLVSMVGEPIVPVVTQSQWCEGVALVRLTRYETRLEVMYTVYYHLVLHALSISFLPVLKNFETKKKKAIQL